MESITKILVVDDEASIRFFLKELLEHDGYQVTAVDSGEAALKYIEQEEFDLALIDLMMKGVSGTQVLKELRAQSPDTVVIMLTGHGSLESAVEALRQGAHDYLFKPCKTIELRESIRVGLLNRQQKKRQRALLWQLEHHLSSTLADVRATIGGVGAPPVPAARTAASANPPAAANQPAAEHQRFMQRGRLIVDLTRHVITMDGKLLELSPTEFDILAYLISEAPRVIPPQELLREAQGYATELWEARDIIRYHIYRIRQKIKEATGDTDIIQTVRGVGYTVKDT
ncbi:MAG TPA: response regulator transcription factor [Anaerolineae bacterium]|nr:response regulator transcription factor [Anaerolineae bacterium]HQI86441.1 response regulator transcription factor [Anaerolineae bacterium]